MKTLPVALKAHIDTLNTTLAIGMKITRADGAILAITSHDQDITITSQLYSSKPGLMISDLVMDSGLAVGNLELTTLHDGAVFSMLDIIGGLWRGAEFVIFRFNYAALSNGIDTLLTGKLGEVEVRQGSVVAELRDWRQYLQQNVGDVSSKTCRARLGDARCKKDISTFTKFGTITGATSQLVFEDTGFTQAEDYFGEGVITWVTGLNAGLSNKIAQYTAAGEFTLALPAVAEVQVGDTYSAIAGDRKRLEEDCRDKFDNVLNFVGEPHRTGRNSLTQSPSGTPLGMVINAQPFNAGPPDGDSHGQNGGD